MEIIVTAPFGSRQQETGVLCMLSNYLTYHGIKVGQLRCNGVFSICDRDEAINWSRRLDSCQECMGEQLALSMWARSEIYEFSTYLSARDSENTKRGLARIKSEELVDFEWEGQRVYPLIQKLFHARFGVLTPDLQNRNHEQVLRRLLTAASRMLSLSSAMFSALNSHIVLSADGDNYISSSYRIAAEKHNIPLVLVRWNASARGVQFKNVSTGKELMTDLIVSNISSIRADCRTWPNELLSVLDQISQFLGIVKEDVAQSAAG